MKKAEEETGQGTLAEVRAMYERMRGEAERQAEAQRLEAKTRGPLTRVLLALTLLACLLAVATGIYGVYNFPDAPIRQTDAGYRGKTGTVRTRADYESYLKWKSALLVTFPAVFVFGFAFAIADTREKRKRRAA